MPTLDPRNSWHIGDILSLVMDYVVSPRGYPAVVALQDHLADRPLSTADRVLYEGVFRGAILAQYPAFRAFSNDGPIPEELLPEWLRRRVAEFGEYLPVQRLAPDHSACVRVICPAKLDEVVGESGV